MRIPFALPENSFALPPIKNTVITVIIIQSILGLAIMIYGAISPVVDIAKAEEMLMFIEESNPEYYKRLTDVTNTSYLKEFYENYSEKGNKRVIFFGMFFMMIAINMAIPMMYVLLTEKNEEIPKDLEGEQEEGETESKNEEEEDDELF